MDLFEGFNLLDNQLSSEAVSISNGYEFGKYGGVIKDLKLKNDKLYKQIRNVIDDYDGLTMNFTSCVTESQYESIAQTSFWKNKPLTEIIISQVSNNRSHAIANRHIGSYMNRRIVESKINKFINIIDKKISKLHGHVVEPSEILQEINNDYNREQDKIKKRRKDNPGFFQKIGIFFSDIGSKLRSSSNTRYIKSQCYLSEYVFNNKWVDVTRTDYSLKHLKMYIVIAFEYDGLMYYDRFDIADFDLIVIPDDSDYIDSIF